MAEDLDQRIESIKSKTRVLVARYARLEELLKAKSADVAMLTEALNESRRRVAELERENEYLRNARGLDTGSGDVAQTRGMIAELVREIDKCISDLSD